MKCFSNHISKILSRRCGSVLVKIHNSSVQCKSVRGGCEAQARKGKGGPLRRKALKLKPLPRAYIKVGWHPPPTHHPPGSLITLD